VGTLDRHPGVALAGAGAALWVASFPFLLVPLGCQWLQPTVTATQSSVPVRRIRRWGS
jgi:hypothetical protein